MEKNVHSVSEAAKELGVPYKRVCRWIKELGLGQKFGAGSWIIILSDDDLATLKKKVM